MTLALALGVGIVMVLCVIALAWERGRGVHEEVPLPPGAPLHAPSNVRIVPRGSTGRRRPFDYEHDG